MIIILNISSKNYVSLVNFIKKFFNKTFIKSLGISIKKYTSIIPTKSTLYTVLKSPHVNKSAQEQFLSKIFTIQIEIFLYQPLLFFIFLKIFKSTLISDVSINYKIISNKIKFEQNFKLILNPNRFKFYFINKKKTFYYFFIKRYIGLLSIYGQFLLLNKKI